MRYHRIPNHTLPHHTIPYPTKPISSMVEPYHTTPHRTAPHLTTPYLIGPISSMVSPYLTIETIPHLTRPNLTIPHRTIPHPSQRWFQTMLLQHSSHIFASEHFSESLGNPPCLMKFVSPIPIPLSLLRRTMPHYTICFNINSSGWSTGLDKCKVKNITPNWILFIIVYTGFETKIG